MVVLLCLLEVSWVGRGDALTVPFIIPAFATGIGFGRHDRDE